MCHNMGGKSDQPYGVRKKSGRVYRSWGHMERTMNLEVKGLVLDTNGVITDKLQSPIFPSIYELNGHNSVF